MCGGQYESSDRVTILDMSHTRIKTRPKVYRRQNSIRTSPHHHFRRLRPEQSRKDRLSLVRVVRGARRDEIQILHDTQDSQGAIN